MRRIEFPLGRHIRERKFPEFSTAGAAVADAAMAC
jgi:hypothetical protein